MDERSEEGSDGTDGWGDGADSLGNEADGREGRIDGSGDGTDDWAGRTDGRNVRTDGRGVQIAGRTELARTGAHETALACVAAGIEAAAPERAVRSALSVSGDRLVVEGVDPTSPDRSITVESYDIDGFEEVLVLGGGKAGAAMARTVEALLGDRITDGLVVTYASDGFDGTGYPGADGPDDRGRTDADGSLAVRPGDHPVPTDRNVAATRRLLELADTADEHTLVIVLLSGGASALLTAPAEGVSLGDLQSTTRRLLESGAPIDAINAVRKHCSTIKGGRLAERIAPGTTITLAISDVVGDDPSVIGSGPTVADETTFQDALDVLDRWAVDPPTAVRRRLERGDRGEERETPGSGELALEGGQVVLAASGSTAVTAVRAEAVKRDYDATVLSSTLRGEAREVGLVLASVAEEIHRSGEPVDPPAVVIAGGETTVRVRGGGVGGPNQELALGVGIELAAGDGGAVLAAVDTDGIDGPTDAAGALVDATTVDDPNEARHALRENGSYEYLDGAGTLVRTGPTGTNVNDLIVLVVE